MLGIMALVVVALGLAVTTWAQVRPMSRYRDLLDMLAIVPEWRFYAQASFAKASDVARDMHLVIRDRDAGGRVGGWQPVVWPAERRVHHGLWNPRFRVDTIILSVAEDLADACTPEMPATVQQSIAYLVLLRRALEAPRAMGDTIDRQFAVVHTAGRGQRAISIHFLSAWHRW